MGADSETQTGEEKDAKAIGLGIFALIRRAPKLLKTAFNWRLVAAIVTGYAVGGGSGSGCAIMSHDNVIRRDLDTLKMNMGLLLVRSDEDVVRRLEYEKVQERMPGFDRARDQYHRELRKLREDSLRLHGQRPLGVTRKPDTNLLATRRPQ